MKKLIADKNKQLVGKRAKFKNNLSGYAKWVWNKAGVIVTSKHTPYLYLQFDEPLKTRINTIAAENMIIYEDSIELEITNCKKLEELNKLRRRYGTVCKRIEKLNEEAFTLEKEIRILGCGK